MNSYVNVLGETWRGENINSCKDRTHIKKIRSTNPLSSLRREKSDFRVVLREEQKSYNGTIILADPGVKKYWDWKPKDYFSL